MGRDGMPRAYLRIDPNIDQVYPVLRGTFVGLLCAAHRQPERGRFRDRALVEALCGKAYVRRAFERGDAVTLSDGRVYVVGWDEWQEGDLTVAERMRRMRARRSRTKRDAVTQPPSPDRPVVTTDAVGTTSLVGTVGDSDDDSPPPQAGRRKNGTNPRALGTNPRANGTSPRQERQAEKRGAIPESTASILRRAAAEGRSS